MHPVSNFLQYFVVLGQNLVQNHLIYPLPLTNRIYVFYSVFKRQHMFCVVVSLQIR